MTVVLLKRYHILNLLIKILITEKQKRREKGKLYGTTVIFENIEKELCKN